MRFSGVIFKSLLSPSSRKAGIEMLMKKRKYTTRMSPSSRKAGIEIPMLKLLSVYKSQVAFLTEGGD